MDATQTEAVSELVVKGFTDLGASSPQSTSRSLLLREGHYAGQRFSCDGFQAVWWLGGDAVEFYDASGRLLKSLNFAVTSGRAAA
jgi:hypothetical protein